MPHSASFLVVLTLLTAAPHRLRAAGSPAVTDDVWREARVVAPAGARPIAPSLFRSVRLDWAALDQRLRNVPFEGTPAVREDAAVVTIPEPGGGLQRFRIVESPILEAPLAARFPEIRTYAGQGIDDPAATVRFDVTPLGFHAMILSSRDTIYVDPFQDGDLDHYMSYFRRDLPRAADEFRCLVDDTRAARRPQVRGGLTAPSGATLRTYRTAIAATGEYTAFKGGTVQAALSGITTTLNRVTGIYERDLSIRFVLVANETSIIYTNAATDPYTNGDANAMLDQAQNDIDAKIGQANYDLGHVFGINSGGLAARGVCENGDKANGVTGSASPTGDAFDVDYVAHEMGHQFGAEHTFNATGSGTSGCNGNRNQATAFEPGSGSTIMGFAGSCAGENLQSNRDDYFHASSIDEILTYLTGDGGACPISTATGNQPPTVSAGAAFTIPARTPFTLTATGSDPNGDTVTYTWEQYNQGAAAPPDTDDGTRAIFRSFKGTTSPSRTFPKLSDVLSGTSTFGESLPTTTRSLSFKVTARDNRTSGGGRSDSSVTLTVAGGAGPLTVSQPAAGASWRFGTSQTVSWNVAGTAGAPVNCSTVNIALSTDGGSTFSQVLASAVPNSGSASVTAPSTATSQARVRVSCATNIFFNVNPGNFTVATGVGSCTANGTTLCISNRFKIQVTWATSQGGGLSGTANAVSTSSIGFSSGGIFWFFDATNPEMLVKVLNGCATNNRYWVFETAGTNVGFTMTVTDTATGTVKAYTNTDLSQAAPVQDTTAFATCP